MRYICITIGTILMYIIVLMFSKKYEIDNLKCVLIPIYLTFSGVIGTFILYYIENGKWGGISFYGSVFLIPIMLIPFSKLIKFNYFRLLDIAVPQISIMLASMKVACFIDGCCGGKLLYITNNGTSVYFPSQLVEMGASIFILILMFYFQKKSLLYNLHYPIYFLIYGSIRLILNFFRDGVDSFIWIIPAGHFWSMISIILGGVFIIIHYYKKLD